MSTKYAPLALLVVALMNMGCTNTSSNIDDNSHALTTSEESLAENEIIHREDVQSGRYVISPLHGIDLQQKNFDGLIATNTQTKEQISMQATINSLLPDMEVDTLILFSQLSENQYILILGERDFGDWVRPVYYKFDVRDFSIEYMNINSMFDASVAKFKDETTKFGKYVRSPDGKKFVFAYDKMRGIPYEATSFSVADLVNDTYQVAVELEPDKETLDATGRCHYDPLVDIQWEDEDTIRYAVYDLQKKYEVFGNICAPVEDPSDPEYVKQFFLEYRTYFLQ